MPNCGGVLRVRSRIGGKAREMIRAWLEPGGVGDWERVAAQGVGYRLEDQSERSALLYNSEAEQRLLGAIFVRRGA